MEYTVKGKVYTSRFKEGDRVSHPYYCGVLVLDCIDEMNTVMCNKLNWCTVSEDYIKGSSKTNNGEIYNDSELEFV
jgi:hypothetical protein